MVNEEQIDHFLKSLEEVLKSAEKFNFLRLFKYSEKSSEKIKQKEIPT